MTAAERREVRRRIDTTRWQRGTIVTDRDALDTTGTWSAVRREWTVDGWRVRDYSDSTGRGRIEVLGRVAAPTPRYTGPRCPYCGRPEGYCAPQCEGDRS